MDRPYLVAAFVSTFAVLLSGLLFARSNEVGVADYELVDGGWMHIEFTGNYDGKDVPVTGAPDNDTVSQTRINATTVQRLSKKRGKLMTTQIAIRLR